MGNSAQGMVTMWRDSSEVDRRLNKQPHLPQSHHQNQRSILLQQIHILDMKFDPFRDMYPCILNMSVISITQVIYTNIQKDPLCVF